MHDRRGYSIDYYVGKMHTLFFSTTTVSLRSVHACIEHQNVLTFVWCSCAIQCLTNQIENVHHCFFACCYGQWVVCHMADCDGKEDEDIRALIYAALDLMYRDVSTSFFI